MFIGPAVSIMCLRRDKALPERLRSIKDLPFHFYIFSNHSYRFSFCNKDKNAANLRTTCFFLHLTPDLKDIMWMSIRFFLEYYLAHQPQTAHKFA